MRDLNWWKQVENLVNAAEPIAKGLVDTKRAEGESYADYRSRRDMVHLAEKLRAKGTILHNSTETKL